MSDDWKPGDLALCVNTRIITPRNLYNSSVARLRSGAVYTVEALSWSGLIMAEVKSSHPDGGYNAARFRRIKPHTPDREDAEVIALLNGAGVKEASDA